MHGDLKPTVAAHREFSISRDPFLRLSQRLHVARSDGWPRATFLVALTWIPLCVGALMRIAFGDRPAPILFDITVHTRLLLVIPLLLVADHMLERRCHGAVAQLYDGAFCDPEKLDRIVARADRLRDSKLVEIAILAAVVIGGQATLWGLGGATGWVSGVEEAGGLSFARIWYASVGLPVMQFLVARWLWHWAIWSYVLIHVSRLNLATDAMHPDHTGGLRFLGGAVTAFWVFAFAQSSMAASAWGTQMLATGASIQSFVPAFVAFILVLALLAFGPLLAYIDVLYRARYRATHVYNGLALEYVRSFHHKWIEARSEHDELLGSQDIQALNDMGGAFESLMRIRTVPFGPRLLAGLWLSALVPMLPLIMLTMPVAELLRHIGSAMLGGLL